MENPFISIITPTLNVESTIRNTLNSIKCQTYKNFEHIVIDANSQDRTCEIVKEYARLIPVSLVSEPDNGISDAFNKGVHLSRGKWIIFLGAGDELIDNTILEKVSIELLQRPNHLIVWGNVIYKGINGEIGRHNSGNHPKSRLKIFNCYPHQAVFHNRKLFNKYGYFNIDEKAAMDYDLFTRAYDDISESGYINLDIAYWLTNGLSHIGNNAIKGFLRVQLRHGVWPIPIAYSLFYWAQFKNVIKKIIMFDPYGIS